MEMMGDHGENREIGRRLSRTMASCEQGFTSNPLTLGEFNYGVNYLCKVQYLSSLQWSARDMRLRTLQPPRCT